MLREINNSMYFIKATNTGHLYAPNDMQSLGTAVRLEKNLI